MTALEERTTYEVLVRTNAVDGGSPSIQCSTERTFRRESLGGNFVLVAGLFTTVVVPARDSNY